jgi:hypothetical protein
MAEIEFEFPGEDVRSHGYQPLLAGKADREQMPGYVQVRLNKTQKAHRQRFKLAIVDIHPP